MTLNDVAQLVKLLDKSSLTEISFNDETSQVVLKKALSAVSVPLHQMQQMASSPPNLYPAAPSPAPQTSIGSQGEKGDLPEKPAYKYKEVTSPMVGTYYASSSPTSPSLVQVGATVKSGQVLCIIEAMKIMNEIESDTAGVVEEICLANETPVEYGTVLFRIRPG